MEEHENIDRCSCHLYIKRTLKEMSRDGSMISLVLATERFCVPLQALWKLQE